MGFILYMITFLLINVGLLFWVRWEEKYFFVYDTRFCRDVRIISYMHSHKVNLEKMRKKLNSVKSKF